jgi:hypothetical protein
MSEFRYVVRYRDLHPACYALRGQHGRGQLGRIFRNKADAERYALGFGDHHANTYVVVLP